MAALNFNLLPKDLAAGKGVIRYARILNTISIVTAAIFVLLTVGAIALLILTNSRLRDLQARVDELTTEARALEVVERDLILTKDRLGKISTVLAQRDVEQIVALQNQVIDTFPEGTNLREARVEKDVSQVRFITNNSTNLSQILNDIRRNPGEFTVAVIENFAFNPFSGFDITLNLF